MVITNQGTGPASGILLTIRPNTFDDEGEPRDITADIVRITFNGASLSQVPGQLPHTVSLGELVLAPGGSLEIDVALKSRPEALTLSPPAVHLSTVVDSLEIDADETNNLRRFAVPVEVPTSDWDLGFDLPSDPVPVGTPFRVIVRVGNMGPAAGNPVVKLFFDPTLGVTAPPACEPVSPDEAWLIKAFRELYGRPPTRQELAEALPIIQTTGNRQATGQALLGSAEHHGFIVRQLHLALRGTPPTEAELASAVLRLQAGAQLGVLAFEILSALPATPAEVVRTVESAKAYLDGSLETIERRSFDVVTQPGFNLEGYLRDSVTPSLINLWVPGKTLEELIAPTDPQAVIYLCELDELPAGGQVELPFDLTPHYPGDYVVDGEVTSGQADPTPGNNRVTEGIEVTGPQDFGDAPAVALAVPGFPPVPGGYPTLTAANGARHGVDPRLGLGLLTDAEMDGQSDNFSLGDDFRPAAPDDEDGVIFLTPVVPLFFGIVAADLGEAGNVVQVLVRARVPADKSAQLRAWVDFNRDGDWNDAGEQVIANQVVKAGVTQFGFRLPAITSRGFSHARFRLFTAGNPLPTGPALDGEVEDHFVLLGGLDRGDAPVLYGAAPHLQPLVPLNFLGTRVDPDPVQPSLDARADDTDADGDDEDGVAAVGPFFAGVDTSLVVTASQAGFVNLWIDYNGVNGFEEFPALPDPTEYVNASILGLPMGMPPAPFPVVAGPNVIRFRVPDRLKSGLSFLRVRYTSQAIPNLGPINLAPDGEVEDYRVQLYSLMPDFGDAPDSLEKPQYPTLRANDGAFHLVTEDRFHLGQRVDIEPDGFPSLDALGDDQDNGLENPANPEPDDEDGVRFSGLWTPGQMATVELTVTAQNPGPAFVNAWVDFNLDFDWADAGEHVLVNTPVVDGLNLLSLNVPANARPGITYARFRLTRDEGTRFNGPATSGEVEDYVVIVDSVANGLQFDSFTQSNNGLELRWSGNAVLESAPTVQGPWTRVQGATSPFRRVIGPETVIFYRLVRP